jgi:phosphatidate cytidylyltransferase
VLFAAAALFLFWMGPTPAMYIVVPVIIAMAAELFSALRRAGYQPIALLGLVATAGLVVGAYHRGEAALPVVLFLSVVFGLVWFLFEVETESPVLNVGATVLGIVWIGMFGSYAALMLRAPDGVGLLLGAIVATVGYDVGGLFVGRNAGTTPLSKASPNKTREGLIGGALVAIVLSLVFASILKVDPFTTFSEGLKLGLVVAVAAPLGDLCQSLVKRDLGIKDMGTILPGHGGFLDRFDALLFVLPSVYYLARLSDFFIG